MPHVCTVRVKLLVCVLFPLSTHTHTHTRTYVRRGVEDTCRETETRKNLGEDKRKAESTGKQKTKKKEKHTRPEMTRNVRQTHKFTRPEKKISFFSVRQR